MRYIVGVVAGSILLTASAGLAFAQAFDGKWTMSIVGGSNCSIKSDKIEITIDGSRVWKSSRGAKLTGTVDESGLLKLSGRTQSGSGNVLRVHGQLKGNKGEGRYSAVTCRGSFTMTKQ